MTALATIGDNNPPGPLDSAKDALAELNAYLLENPVIQDQKQAKQAGAFIERTRISLKSLEDERTEKVGPLNVQLKALNDLYRGVRDPLEKVLLELKRRVTAYTTAEEDKRRAEAERLRAEAEAAAMAAKEATQAADNAVAEADLGVIADVGAVIADADAAIKAAGKAERIAARAERESVARIGSVMGGRAQVMRDYEVLTITDAITAIKVLGITEKIEQAILSSAREFRKVHGELPKGIAAMISRRL